MTRNILMLGAVLLLAACGFSPLYGKHSAGADQSVRAEMGRIYIANIADQSGQYLRNALMDRFYSTGRPGANAPYTLSIATISESRSELDITKTSDSTRAQLYITTSMVLSNQDGEELVKRSLTAVTSYNILDSQFTTRVAEDAARRQALDDVARQIETHLLLYFNHK
jgi:LPS-assembly lipoprotein